MSDVIIKQMNELIDKDLPLSEDNIRKIYPITHEKGVVDDNGNTLDNKISSVIEQASSAATESATVVKDECIEIKNECAEIREETENILNASGLSFDITKYHSGSTYSGLTVALSDVPEEFRTGGMTVKFILQLYTVSKTTSQTEPTGTLLTNNPNIAVGTKYKASDLSAFSTLPTSGDSVVYYVSNGEETPTYTIYTISKNAVNACEYEQYRYMGTVTTNATFINMANWQGIDDEPTSGSENLVESGGVYESVLKTLSYSGLPDKTIENGRIWRGNVGEVISTNTSSSPSNFRLLNAIPVKAGITVKVKTKLSNSTAPRFIITDNNNIITRRFAIDYDNKETTIIIENSESLLYINGNDLETILLEVTTKRDGVVDEKINSIDHNSIIRDAKLGVLEINEFANDGTTVEFNANLGDKIVISFEGTGGAIAFLDSNGNIIKEFISDTELYSTEWVNVIKRISLCKARYSAIHNLKVEVLRYEAKSKDDVIESVVTTIKSNQDKYSAEDIADNTESLALSESDFELGNLQGGTGIEVSSTKVIRTKEYLKVVSGCTIKTSTANSYRNEIFEFDKDKNYLANTNWQVGTSELTLRSDTEYVRLLVGSPSGADYSPVWEDAGYSVIPSKVYIKAKATSKGDVEKMLNGYFNIESPIFAPSPQLPANDDSESDFNIETVTSTELHAAFESLISKQIAYDSGTVYSSKNLNRYEVNGMDESGVYPIYTYVYSRRNRYAFRHSDELYAWKDGSNNIKYIDSTCPRQGDIIYSDVNRTDSGKTVASYNSSTGIMTDSSSVAYTRGEDSNVKADMFWTTKYIKKENPTSLTALDRTGQEIGTATYIDNTHLSLNGKSYVRSECFDYHTDNKATIFIWANEHGPTSDPIEPSVVLYRFIKDLCGGCRNNQFMTFLKTYCKIVFIPCANPWGCQYPRVTGRYNSNSVNINRNYDTPGWSQQTESDKGSNAGSENETQYIMNMCRRFTPDISIDIHCLGYVNPIAQGIMYLSGSYIPSNEFYNRTVDAMSGLGFLFDHRGDPIPESEAHGNSWLDWIGYIGGTYEMNAGNYSLTYNGEQHTAVIMEACYTLFLNSIRMWYAQYDSSLDLSKMSIK